MAAAGAENEIETVRPPSGETPISLRANVLANYISQAWVALAGILMMPFYLRHMGAEAYGLIGFFTLMNAWFQILDAGLSLTLARESARYRAGVIDAATLQGLFRTLELLFFGVAALGALAIAASAHAIASSWLKVERLPIGEVAEAVLLMGLTVPLQWVTGLYRGALNGFERQIWLAGFNSAIATLRFGGAAIVILLLGPKPLNFFTYQLILSAGELLALIWMGHSILPTVDAGLRRFLRWPEVRDLLKFSGSLAFAVVVWVLVTQIDKLVLSKILPLAEYGVFTLAVAAASGVLLLGGPIAQAVLPRLTKVSAEGGGDGVIRLYRGATQMVCLITVPAALTLAVFSGPIIFAWTGDTRAATAAGPILAPYALGNAIMTLGAFPYYLQYARGDLRLHVIGNILLVILLVPALFLAASRFGAVGAGYAWLGVNVLYLIAWIPWVHRRLAPGLHWRWLVGDILPIASAAALAAIVLSAVVVWPKDRVLLVTCVGSAGGALVLCAACGSSVARDWAWIGVRRIAARIGAHRP